MDYLSDAYKTGNVEGKTNYTNDCLQYDQCCEGESKCSKGVNTGSQVVIKSFCEEVTFQLTSEERVERMTREGHILGKDFNLGIC